MARKKNTESISDAGPTGQRVGNPIEQRSPNDRGTGGYDPEDYHGSGPIPLGNAPVHREEPGSPSIPIGVDLDENTESNPGDVPNTDSEGDQASREALGDRVQPD